MSVFGELQNALDRIWRAPPRRAAGLWRLIRARAAVVRHGARRRLPAHRLVWSRAPQSPRSASSSRRTLFGGWVVVAEGLNFGRQLRARDGDLRDDLQDHAARADRLARRLDRRRGDGAAVHDRQVADRRSTSAQQPRLGFGAAGSLVVLLVWIYYSAQIFLLGAEFTHGLCARARVAPDLALAAALAAGDAPPAARALARSRAASPTRSAPAR